MSLVIPVLSRVQSRLRERRSATSKLHPSSAASHRSFTSSCDHSSLVCSYQWGQLPSSLLSHCFRFLSPSTLISLRLVSRSLSMASLLPSSWLSSSLTWQQWLSIIQPALAASLSLSSTSVFTLDTRNSSILHLFQLLPYYLPCLSSYTLSSPPPALFRASIAFLPYLRSLHFLDLSHCSEVDSTHLACLTHLRLLGLSLNMCLRVDDNAARHLARMRHLQAVDLRGTLFTQDGLYRVMLSTALQRAAEAAASAEPLVSELYQAGAGVAALREAGAGPSPRLLFLSASPQRVSFFSPLASLSHLLSLHLQLAWCQQPLVTVSSVVTSQRSLLHNNLCLHALSQLSPRLRVLQLEGISEWMEAMAESGTLPSVEDWFLFLCSFTHLSALRLSDLDGRRAVFGEAFCRRLFPYLAASLEQLELHWSDPRELALDAPPDHRWEHEAKADEWTAGEGDSEEGDAVSSSPSARLSERAVDRTAVPISTFYLLPLLSALSLHHADVTPTSAAHWERLSSDLSSLTALELRCCLGKCEEGEAAIRACLPRLTFLSVRWAESNRCWKDGEYAVFEQLEVDQVGREPEPGSSRKHSATRHRRKPCAHLPPYSVHADYLDGLSVRWKQAAQWDKAADPAV